MRIHRMLVFIVVCVMTLWQAPDVFAKVKEGKLALQYALEPATTRIGNATVFIFFVTNTNPRFFNTLQTGDNIKLQIPINDETKG